ncbi:MAG TPA: hypothetical protein VFE10_00985 [Phenylobacterium sp.]|jgi:hypothetical protein|nr:hypothetical protein [Phenylobacterium sp.]
MPTLRRVGIYLAIALPLGGLAFWAIGSAFGYSHLWQTPVLVAVGIGVANHFWPIQARRRPKLDTPKAPLD